KLATLADSIQMRTSRHDRYLMTGGCQAKRKVTSDGTCPEYADLHAAPPLLMSGQSAADAQWRTRCSATAAGCEAAGLFDVGHLQIAADLLQTLFDLVETWLQTIERPGHGHEIVGAVPAEGRRERDDRLGAFLAIDEEPALGTFGDVGAQLLRVRQCVLGQRLQRLGQQLVQVFR